MGREKDPKGEGKVKHKTTKLKRLSDCDNAGAGAEIMKNRWAVFEEEEEEREYGDSRSLSITLSLFYHERWR